MQIVLSATEALRLCGAERLTAHRYTHTTQQNKAEPVIPLDAFPHVLLQLSLISLYRYVFPLAFLFSALWTLS